MPSDSKTATPKSKSSTRSSIRQSLNLASTVGKAFAGVIGKDSREASKNAKKTKDASRHASALISPPVGPFNVTSSTPTKSKVVTPSNHKSSSRPTKMVKTGATPNPHPISSASSSSTPSTPKGFDVRGSSARSERDISKLGSPNTSPGSSRGSPSP